MEPALVKASQVVRLITQLVPASFQGFTKQIQTQPTPELLLVVMILQVAI